MSTVSQNLIKADVGNLVWLADAPLFIDAAFVESFYDAMVQPEHLQTAITLTSDEATTEAVTASVGGEVGIGLPGFLSSLLPSLSLKGEQQEGTETTHRHSATVELTKVDNPYRQLVHLAIHYLGNLGHRVFRCTDDVSSWPTDEEISDGPRPLAFVDLPPGVQLLPTALETVDGKVHAIYEDFMAWGAPSYPHADQTLDPDELAERRATYWNWFMENYDSTSVLEAIEKTVANAGQLIEWIDFRIALWGRDDHGNRIPIKSPHLHVAPRGNHSTGTFAYNFVRRGFKHGLRLVGTLKSEPDLNVLAIFEK